MAGKSKPRKTDRIASGSYRGGGRRDDLAAGMDPDSCAIPKIGGNDMTDRRKNMMNDLKRIESLTYWIEGYIGSGETEQLVKVMEIRGLSRKLMEAIEIEEMLEEQYE